MCLAVWESVLCMLELKSRQAPVVLVLDSHTSE